MEVTRKNQLEILPKLNEHIQKSFIISFDLEMTGITGDKAEMYSDIPSEAQVKKREAAKKFGVIQVGLACFIPNHSVHKNQDVQVYNIWVKPIWLSEITRGMHEDSNVMAFESKCVNFLNKHSSLDWNKFLREGVPQLGKAQLAELAEFQREKLLEKTSNNNTKLDHLFPEEEEREKNKQVEMIRNYVGQGGNREYTVENELKPPLLRWLFDQVRLNHWGKAYLQLTEDDQFSVETGPFKLFIFESEEEFGEHLGRVQSGLEAKMTEVAGFTRIFQTLIPSKKVLVGHNCFCDLLFLFQHFDDPLPVRLLEFKKHYNNTFVNCYDTKIIAESEVLEPLLEGKSTLNELQQRVRKDEREVFTTPNIRPIYGNKEKGYEALNAYHQAGFDAFMTGFVFLKMKEQYSLQDRKGFIDRFKNKIYIQKSLQILNMSNNEDDLLYKDQNRLFYFRTGEERRRPGQNDLKRLLRLTEDFSVRFNSDEDFFIYLGPKDSEEFFNGIRKLDNNWTQENFFSQEERVKRQQDTKVDMY